MGMLDASHVAPMEIRVPISLRSAPLLFCLATLGVLGTAAADTLPPRAFMSTMRTDQELIRVQLGEVRMAIPAAYLDAPIQQDERIDVFLTEDGFHVTQGVYIVTELPELTARTEESMREWLKARGYREKGKWISALIRDWNTEDAAGPSESNLTIHGGLTALDHWGVPHPKVTGTRHGLDRRVNERMKRDIYTRTEDGVRTALIVCRLEGSVPSPGCSQFIEVAGLDVKMNYGKQNLPRWRELERKMRARLEGFMAAATNLTVE